MKWLSLHPEASWQDVLFALEKSQEYSLASRVYQKLAHIQLYQQLQLFLKLYNNCNDSK